MSKKVTRGQLTSLMQRLGLVEDLQFYSHIDSVTMDLTDTGRELRHGGSFQRQVASSIERLDNDDNELADRIDDVDDKFDLLLEYLGLEFDEGPRIIKKKKGKK